MHRALKVGIFLALFLGAVAIVPANAQNSTHSRAVPRAILQAIKAASHLIWR
jgi:hypothetical protein